MAMTKSLRGLKGECYGGCQVLVADVIDMFEGVQIAMIEACVEKG